MLIDLLEMKREVGGFPLQYLHNMRCLMALLIGSLSTVSACAQQDSLRSESTPWIEAAAGYRAVVGVLGVNVGFPLRCQFVPAMAVGVGFPEGGHLSLGMEHRTVRTTAVEVGPYAYWSYVTGRNHGESAWGHTKVSAGQMVKCGAYVALKERKITCVLRVGYAWALDRPYAIGPWAGHMGNNEPRPILDGFSASIGVRFPISG
jgi:hypothetical protein